MGNIMILIAVICFVAAIITGSVTENTWRNTAMTWSILSVGITLFGIALTL
jgi:hypothetical protein